MPRRTLRRPSPGLVVAAVALVLAIGGVAYATIPDASGTIHGCYDGRGALRVVDPQSGGSCLAGETALSWNQQGVAGPPGATGPAGSPATASPPPPDYALVDDRRKGLKPDNKQGQPAVVIADLTLPAGSYFVFAKGDVLLLPAVRTGRKAGWNPAKCQLGQADANAVAAHIAGAQPHMLDAATLGATGDLSGAPGSLSESFALQIQATVGSTLASQHVLLKCGLVSRKAGGTISEVKLFAMPIG